MARSLRPCPTCSRPMEADRHVCATCQQQGREPTVQLQPAAPKSAGADRRVPTWLGTLIIALPVLIVGIVLGSSVGLWGWGPDDPVPTAQPVTFTRPGNPQVYQRIENLTDCAALRAELAIAVKNHQREAEAGPERDRFEEITGSYVRAAEDRIKQLGCP